MNKENDLSPIIISDIEASIEELATINQFETIKSEDLPEDLVDTIINLNL